MTLWLLLGCCPANAETVTAAAEAQEITRQTVLTRNGKRSSKLKEMKDGRYSTFTTVNRGASIEMTGKNRQLGGFVLRFFDRATAGTVEAYVDGGWQQVAELQPYLSYWYELPEGAEKARITNHDKARMYVAEINVYGTGEKPREAPVWHKLDKADLMLLTAHPDDELLWFGGMIPTYAAERGYAMQLAVLVPTTPLRRLELLDAIWHSGMTAYPAFLGLKDARGKTLEAQYKLWHKNVVWKKTTAVIRKYRPEVLLLHDFGGEYGHGAHRVAADAGAHCAALAADADKYPESAKEYGTWQVKKVYVHLYPENPIKMDWHQPLSAFDGKDGLTVATEGLAFHRSQIGNGWGMEKEGGPNDNSRFGLYATTVGQDSGIGDVMEHIPEADLQPKE